MARRAPNYILVLVLLLVTLSVTLWARSRPDIPLESADLDSIPMRIGHWRCESGNLKVGKDVLEGWGVDQDNFLSRVYINDAGDQISLMVVYKGRDRRNWHVSEMCYSGSGYNVTQDLYKVPYAGRRVDAVRLIAANTTDYTTDIALYWFAQGIRTEASFLRQQADMALSRLRPSEQGWAFVRVTSTAWSSQDETLDNLRDFLSAASDDIPRVLSGKTGK